MRKSFSPITTLVAAFLTIAALSLTGCQSGFQMPSAPSWFSFNKKPSSSSLANKPDTHLPSPSATANPTQPPSYAQNRGTGSSQGTQPAGSYYSDARYGTAPMNASRAPGGASSARGFYSQDYGKAGPGQSPSGSYGTPPSSYARNAAPTAGSNYDSYGPNGFTSSTASPTSGQPWSSSAGGSQYGTTPKSTVGDYEYGRTATRPPASNYDSYGGTGAVDSYSRDSATYGGTPSNYSSSKGVPTYSGGSSIGAGSMPPTSSSSTAPASYLPGSTSRSTQYGDSQNINVAGARDVQPTSYGSPDGLSSYGSATPGRQAAPATHGQESRTATGQQYPSTSESIYHR